VLMRGRGGEGQVVSSTFSPSTPSISLFSLLQYLPRSPLSTHTTLTFPRAVLVSFSSLKMPGPNKKSDKNRLGARKLKPPPLNENGRPAKQKRVKEVVFDLEQRK
jgi:hypothetical protein